MELLLDRLSDMKKDRVYFCINLRKNEHLIGDDVSKVQKIINKMEKEKTGFRVKELKCITTTEHLKAELDEKGLQTEVELILLGSKKRNISDTKMARSLKYDAFPDDDEITNYLIQLNEKCAHNPQKGSPCSGCRESREPCQMSVQRRMNKVKRICDLIIQFERR